MHTSRFQFGLIATLAVGLGFSLASSDAIGYPAGAAVSMGENPLWSIGGFRTDPGNVDVVTAPPDQDLVIQDVVFATSENGVAQPALSTSGHASLAQFLIFGANYNGGGPIVAQFNGGLTLPAGETLKLNTNSHHDVYYTLSGYYAER